MRPQRELWRKGAAAVCLIGAAWNLTLAAPPAADVVPAADAQPAAKKSEHVRPEAHLSVDRLPAGGKCDIIVRLHITEGWHINANPAQPDYMVPTAIEFKGKLGTRLAQIKYPKGAKLELPDFDEPLSVYEQRVDLRGTLEIPESAAGQQEEMEIVVKYQACNDKKCLPPATVKLNGKLQVAKVGESVKAINEKLFAPPKTQ